MESPKMEIEFRSCVVANGLTTDLSYCSGIYSIWDYPDNRG